MVLMSTSSYTFGRFKMLTCERRLERDGEPIRIGARAFDLLTILVENAGTTVTKQAIWQHVWPGIHVGEGSLRFQLFELRRLLNQSGIRNSIVAVPSRGYCFTAMVHRFKDENTSDGASGHILKLPQSMTRMIGRGRDLAALKRLLSEQRIVTIIGVGGIGKTTLAVAVALAYGDARPSDRIFVDLGAVHDPGLVYVSIAASLGVPLQSHDPLPAIIARLQARDTLLILDSVEHLLPAAAEAVERLVLVLPSLQILITSREALRVEGEHVYPLEPLEQPNIAQHCSLVAIQESPAAQLLIERTVAADGRFRFDDSDAPLIAAICEQLDGIPLAIELAAGRIPAFGLKGTIALLSEGLDHLKGGRRNAAQRHRSLKDTLAWSYDLLDARSQTVFRRLSVFVGPFRREAVHSVVGGLAGDVAEILADLVAKSLVSVRRNHGTTRFRLLDTMCSFLRAKLSPDERYIASERHARYYCELLERDGAAAETSIDDVPNVRAALAWSYAEPREGWPGTRLAVNAAQFYQRLSLLPECQSACETAIAALPAVEVGSREEMELQTCLAQAMMYSSGHAPQVLAAFERALGLAARFAEPARQLAIMSALHVYHNRSADFVRGLEVAERGLQFASARGDHYDLALGHLSFGISLHEVGRHHEASFHLAKAMELSDRAPGVDRLAAYATHPNRGGVILAQSLWLRGFPDQAATQASNAVAEIEALGHTLSLAIALSGVPSVFIWRQDWQVVGALLDRHWALAEEYGLAPYKALVLGRRGELAIYTGQARLGVRLIDEALTRLATSNYRLFFTPLRLALAKGYAELDQIDRAVREIDTCILNVEAGGDAMYLPELLRLKAQFSIEDRSASEAAERLLLQAFDIAGEQGALSWQLRAATTLATIYIEQCRRDEARMVLCPVLDRFSEGHDTADLRQAKFKLAAAATCKPATALAR